MRVIHLFGIAGAITIFFMVLTTIYYPASFNDKGIACVSTNTYGEHWIEVVWLSLSLVAFLHFVWESFRDNLREKE